MVTKTTYETKMEYDNDGKVTRKVTTETVDTPDAPVCFCGDCADLLEDTIELQSGPSVLDIIFGAAGVATLTAAICLAVKIIKSK